MSSTDMIASESEVEITDQTEGNAVEQANTETDKEVVSELENDANTEDTNKEAEEETVQETETNDSVQELQTDKVPQHEIQEFSEELEHEVVDKTIESDEAVEACEPVVCDLHSETEEVEAAVNEKEETSKASNAHQDEIAEEQQVAEEMDASAGEETELQTGESQGNQETQEFEAATVVENDNTVAVEEEVENTATVEEEVENTATVEEEVENTAPVEEEVENTVPVEEEVENTVPVEEEVENTVPVEEEVENTAAVEEVESTTVVEDDAGNTAPFEKDYHPELQLEKTEDEVETAPETETVEEAKPVDSHVAAPDAASEGESKAATTSVRNAEIPKSQATPPVRAQGNAGDESCHACHARVYPMEKLTADGRLYHKTCFKCSKCRSTLKMGNFSVINGALLCMPHYMELFKLRGNYDERMEGEQGTPENQFQTPQSTAGGVESGAGNEPTADLPPPDVTRNMLAKFRQMETGSPASANSQTNRRSVSPPHARSSGVGATQSNGGTPDVVRSEDAVPDELPAPETAKAMAAMFRALESNVAPTPEASSKLQKTARLTPRSGVKTNVRLQAGSPAAGSTDVMADNQGGDESSENEPSQLPNDIIRSDQPIVAQLPEEGTTRNLVAHFRQMCANAPAPTA